MDTRPRPRPALLLAALLILAPNAVWARHVTLFLPPVKVTVPKQYTVPPPCNDCTCRGVAAADPATGATSAAGQDNTMTYGSPALFGAAHFNGASSTPTVWGYGWSSDFDHELLVAPDHSVTWLRDDGSQLLFLNTSASTSTAPTLLAPVGTFETIAPGPLSNGALLTATERDLDGTTRTFNSFESTSVLRLSQLVDSNGNTVTYSRDSQGRLTKVTDVHGRYFNLTYNGAGLVASLSDSGGRTTNFTYDGAGNRASEAGPYGTTSYQYDAAHHLTKITYPNSSVRNFTYDSQGRVLTQDDGNGNDALSYVYGSTSTTITDALGHKTIYEFTELQGLRKPVKVTDPAGGVTTYTYDSNFNVATETDPNGHTTHYTYDAHGNVTATQDAAGGTTDTTYELTFNHPTQITDPDNHSTNFGYDTKGNNTSVRDPLSETTNNSFDSFGHVSQTQDPNQNLTKFSYDPATGALASTTDPLNRTTNLVNDALSRVTKNTDPAGNPTQYQYDTASDMTQVTDAAGNITQYTYSPGRTGKLLTQVKDALGHTTTFGYDDLGRLTSVTNAIGQTKTSAYDAKGNLIQTKNARGQVTTYTYDANDRLTKKSMVEGDITYTYDAAGNMLTAHHYNGSSIQNTYDANNRLTQQIQTLPSGYSATLGYTYDAAGNRTSMSTPWGSFSYTYDAANRLTSITNPQNLIFTFAYDAAGRRTKLTYPNGIVTSYTYDAAGQVLSITATRTSDQVIVSSIAYTYNSAGNRTSMTDWAGTHTYGYDNLNRLTSATHPAASNLPVLNETFSYDAVGNRLADAQLTGYTYDVANRLQSNSGFTYSFDADGNLAVRTDSATNRTMFGFNSINELATLTTPAGESWTYAYDIAGRRISKSSTTTSGYQYIYDASGATLGIVDLGGNLISSYVTEPRIGSPLETSNANGRNSFFQFDQTNSVVARTDSNGQLASLQAYGGYGQHSTLFSQVPTDPPDGIGFLGLISDDESGLSLLTVRFFDPLDGRFISEDPLGMGTGVNYYEYARNSPTNLVDPTGLWARGFQIGGSFEGGAFGYGFGFQGSIGISLFGNGLSHISLGGFATGGSLLAGPKGEPGCPLNKGTINGLSLSGGWNYLTSQSALSVNDLEGPFQTQTTTIGWGDIQTQVQNASGITPDGRSIQVSSYSPPVWGGATWGASRSNYPTNTKVLFSAH